MKEEKENPENEDSKVVLMEFFETLWKLEDYFKTRGKKYKSLKAFRKEYDLHKFLDYVLTKEEMKEVKNND
jgi:hypothetical protein